MALWTLPEPPSVSVAEVREKVIPAAARARQGIAVKEDIGRAQELCRQLEAFRKYVRDRDTCDLLAAECRRTEVLIGKFLGPPLPPEETGSKGGRVTWIERR